LQKILLLHSVNCVSTSAKTSTLTIAYLVVIITWGFLHQVRESERGF